MDDERTERLERLIDRAAAENIKDCQKARQKAADEMATSIIAFVKAWDNETKAFEDIFGDIVFGRKIEGKTFNSSIDVLEYMVKCLKEREEDAE